MESKIVSELSLATFKWVVAMKKGVGKWKLNVVCAQCIFVQCTQQAQCACAVCNAMCIEYFRN